MRENESDAAAHNIPLGCVFLDFNAKIMFFHSFYAKRGGRGAVCVVWINTQASVGLAGNASNWNDS
jgi:hypothetical protein